MKHIQHILIVAVVGLVAAVIAVTTLGLLRPADFGPQPPGWSYRAESLKEHADSPPLVYADENSCSSSDCHGKGGAAPVTLAGRNEKRPGHLHIGCQACHGPAQSHVASQGSKDPPKIWQPAKPLGKEELAKLSSEEQAKLKKERDGDHSTFLVGFCLGCHQQLAGRPADLHTIPSFEQHRKECGDGTEPDCTSCHSPHKPCM